MTSLLPLVADCSTMVTTKDLITLPVHLISIQHLVFPFDNVVCTAVSNSLALLVVSTRVAGTLVRLPFQRETDDIPVDSAKHRFQ